jgi:hypothetical protein
MGATMLTRGAELRSQGAPITKRRLIRLTYPPPMKVKVITLHMFICNITITHNFFLGLSFHEC